MITAYFESTLNKKTVPEVSDPSGLFKMWDDGGVEVEVGEFLYGLLRVVKPSRVLETGFYTGVSCSYMAQALKDNKMGKVVTIEHDPQFQKKGMERIRALELSPYVELIGGSSLEVEVGSPYQFILLDTEPDIRFKELVKFWTALSPGSFLFIHDLHRHLSQEDNHELGFGWPFGKLPDIVRDLIIRGEMRTIHLPTPRGMSGFYKVDPRDYKPT